jgi:hypothetical protein
MEAASSVGRSPRPRALKPLVMNIVPKPPPTPDSVMTPLSHGASLHRAFVARQGFGGRGCGQTGAIGIPAATPAKGSQNAMPKPARKVARRFSGSRVSRTRGQSVGKIGTGKKRANPPQPRLDAVAPLAPKGLSGRQGVDHTSSGCFRFAPIAAGSQRRPGWARMCHTSGYFGGGSVNYLP